MLHEDRPDRLPKADLSRLLPLLPADVAFAFAASQRGGAPKQEALEKLALLLGPPLAQRALDAALSEGHVEEKDGILFASIKANGHGKPDHSIPAGGWIAAQKTLALGALAREVPNSAFHGIRKTPDLAAAALRQVYALETLKPFPSKAEVRCALVCRIVSALGPPFAALDKRPLKTFRLDALSRSVYLLFAGLETGTIMQADAALLRAAFGVREPAELAAAIIRLSVEAGLAAAKEKKEEKQEQIAFDLEQFAQSIRGLARTLETKPYTGRVAIAQVYDAGIAAGLSLGSLDEFKLHLAEAAREGLLDLERYDIAGPFDPALKERSRLRLGRDERHFIVNQWI
jgi:hypothetical protein